MSFPSGFVPNPFDPRDVWEHELAGFDPNRPIPARFETKHPGTFEPQGAWPFCVAFSVTGMFERAIRKATGIVLDLSQPHLFFHAGGTPTGTFFRAALDVAVKKGCVSYATLPMPADLYDTSVFDSFRRAALSIPFNQAQKAFGYVRIDPNKDAIKRAIVRYGVVMVGVAGNGGYWKNDKLRPSGMPDNHATRLYGWDDDDGRNGTFLALDSLQPKADFDGKHTFSQDYEFGSVYALAELPKDWKQQRDEARQQYPGALDHYGKPRNLELEQRVAVDLLAAFRRLSDQRTIDAAGRLWTTYVNAIAYGGYNASYRKWFREVPGDVLNDAYKRVRDGKGIFDFDRVRSDYP